MRNLKSTYAIILVLLVCGVLVQSTNAVSMQGNTWDTKKPMPTARGFLGVTAANGEICAIGGGNGGPTEKYNPMANNWTTKTPMPTVLSDFAICAFQGKIYCIGGIPTGANDNNEVYDLATDT